jgi:hypothetical protein
MRRAVLAAVVGLAVLAPDALADDVTPPVISLSVFGTAGDNGWYVSNVLVNWTVSDPESGVLTQTGCGPTTISADTTSTKLTCSATNTVGLPSSQGTNIKRDVTPPAVAANADRAADAGGFYNHPLTATWTGVDATSGIASCTATPYSGSDGASISLTGTCKDKAGNVSAPVPFVFNYDATPPVLGSVTATAGDAGARLAWQVSGADKVMVMRSPTGARAAQSAVVYEGSADTFTDSGLKNGTRYTYLVQALDTAGNAASASTSVTPNADASTKHLLSPGSASSLSRPPMLRWRKIARASYYNVQLFRHGKKILSAWPTKPHYQLRSVWTYRGHRHRLGKATYRWFLWGGYGHRSEHRYGRLLGKRSFTIS